MLPLALLVMWPISTWAVTASPATVNLLCLMAAAAWLIGSAVLFKKNGKDALPEIFALAGFTAGLIFIWKLSYRFSWHDLAGYNPDFTGDEKPDGHLGYVAYLVEFGKLPLDNPMIEGQSVFYNPPAHHILHALFIRLQRLLGIELEVSIENTQLLTLGFATGCIFIVLDLLRFLGIGRRGQTVGMLMMAFQPTMLIFGATVNNDIQMLFLLFAAILFTVRWQRTRAMRDILSCGVSLGLAMATKLSSALIIPCIAIVFATAFFRNLKEWKRYVGQFAAFLAVSVPEAVAWPLFHLIAYQMPLNYVRLPAETINLSRYTLWQRFGIPTGRVLRTLFYSPTRTESHNVWMQTLKTGMFDELTLFEEGRFMWYFTYFAMVMFAVLLLVALILFIRWLIVRIPSADGMTKVFLASYGALLIGNYLKFCVDYPYICTFNFRYIMPVLLLCAVAYAAFADKRRWIAAVPAVFAGMVCVVYGVYFFG